MANQNLSPHILHGVSLYCLFFLKALACTLKMLGKNCNPINTHCHWLGSSVLKMVTQTYSIYLSVLTPNICCGSQESSSPEHLFPNCVLAFVSEFPPVFFFFCHANFFTAVAYKVGLDAAQFRRMVFYNNL